MASSFLRFLDHTQRRTTVGRTPLRSDQPVAGTSTWQHTTLTTDIHPGQRWDSNPQFQQARGPRPTSYNTQLMGSAILSVLVSFCRFDDGKREEDLRNDGREDGNVKVLDAPYLGHKYH